MNTQKSFFIAIILVLLMNSTLYSYQAKVVKVSDGDTIRIVKEDDSITIRLYGIDCPETRQNFGKQAAEFASDMVYGKMVDIEAVTTDRYGRTVGIVSYQDKSLNEELIRHGYAWKYTKYCDKPVCLEWKMLEKNARRNSLGLWGGNNPVPPWKFRKLSSQMSTEIETPGVFHGNIRSKVFHSSFCMHFDCKNCSMIFESRDEALKAGYNPCGICSG